MSFFSKKFKGLDEFNMFTKFLPIETFKPLLDPEMKINPKYPKIIYVETKLVRSLKHVLIPDGYMIQPLNNNKPWLNRKDKFIPLNWIKFVSENCDLSVGIPYINHTPLNSLTEPNNLLNLIIDVQCEMTENFSDPAPSFKKVTFKTETKRLTKILKVYKDHDEITQRDGESGNEFYISSNDYYFCDSESVEVQL